MKRVIVTGSRNWSDRQRIADRLADLDLTPGPMVTIVHGNARGVDRIAHQEAQKLGMYVEAVPADWDYHGKRAGLIRNTLMAEMGADLCLAFWDGRSTGTAHMMREAKRHGIPVEVITK